MNLEKFYMDIISWEYLVKYGYMDLQSTRGQDFQVSSVLSGVVLQRFKSEQICPNFHF